MSISEGFKIKSHLREYQVDFVSDSGKSLAQDLDREHLLIIDRQVMRLHGDRLALVGDSKTLELDATERNKRLSVIPSFVQRIIENGLNKKLG